MIIRRKEGLTADECLNQTLIYKEEDIKLAKSRLEALEKEFEYLKSCKTLTNIDVYNNVEDVVSFVYLKDGEYKHILGGDGRSQPWDETKKGVVVRICQDKGYHLTSEQIDIVKSYFKLVYNAESVDEYRTLEECKNR